MRSLTTKKTVFCNKIGIHLQMIIGFDVLRLFAFIHWKLRQWPSSRQRETVFRTSGNGVSDWTRGNCMAAGSYDFHSMVFSRRANELNEWAERKTRNDIKYELM